MELHGALAGLPVLSDSNVLVGSSTYDDAGVYRLSADMALVQTVDFFTPIVDDPGAFGRIAMANALSDVYAMGGRPINALNILCYPIGELGMETLHDILHGAAEKLKEAGVVLLGGHSVQDKELKFGAAITGLVHPDRIWTNAGAKPGDVLILTKRIGTGVLCNALKAGKLAKDLEREVIDSMSTLNAAAAKACEGATIHACTDVTGFGLAGHAGQMAEASGVTIRIRPSALPLFPGAEGYMAEHRTRGNRTNRAYLAGRCQEDPAVPQTLHDLCFDPQTSGGLLLVVLAAEADALLSRLRSGPCPAAARIGEVVARAGAIVLELVP